MEIILETTICEACEGPALVGLNGRALCFACYELELVRHHAQIERYLLEWDLEAQRRREMIRSPLLCGDEEP